MRGGIEEARLRTGADAGADAAEHAGNRAAFLIGLALQALLDGPQGIGRVGRLDEHEAIGIEPQGKQPRTIGTAMLIGVTDGLHPDDGTRMGPSIPTVPLPGETQGEADGRRGISRQLRLDFVQTVRPQPIGRQKPVDPVDPQAPARTTVAGSWIGTGSRGGGRTPSGEGALLIHLPPLLQGGGGGGRGEPEGMLLDPGDTSPQIREEGGPRPRSAAPDITDT